MAAQGGGSAELGGARVKGDDTAGGSPPGLRKWEVTEGGGEVAALTGSGVAKVARRRWVGRGGATGELADEAEEGEGESRGWDIEEATRGWRGVAWGSQLRVPWRSKLPRPPTNRFFFAGQEGSLR